MRSNLHRVTFFQINHFNINTLRISFILEELSDEGSAATALSPFTSGQSSYEPDVERIENEESIYGKNNANSKHSADDLTVASKTLMISGIPSTYCTKELLQRHFQVRIIFCPRWDIISRNVYSVVH